MCSRPAVAKAAPAAAAGLSYGGGGRAQQPHRRVPAGRRHGPAPLKFRNGSSDAVLDAAKQPHPHGAANDGDDDDAEFYDLLQLAEARTFAPRERRGGDGAATSSGSSGRRAALADAERLLERAVSLKPRAMAARVMLLRNLMLQDRGREADVPPAALAALRALSGSDGDAGGDDGQAPDSAAAAGKALALGPDAVAAMQAVLLGVKACWALGGAGGGGARGEREAGARAQAFVRAACRAAPALADDFAALAARVARRLSGCSAEGRAALLARARYRSCVDLSAVEGAHHAALVVGGADGGGGATEEEDDYDEDSCPAGL